MATTTACPACSGVVTEVSGLGGVGVCGTCGGFVSVRPIELADVSILVDVRGRMKANAEQPKYFDFVYRADGGKMARVHGWFDMKDGRVVQFG